MEKLYSKYSKKKVYYSSAILLMAVHIIILIIAYQVNLRFSLDGQNFKYVSQDENTIFFQDSDESPLSVNIKVKDNGSNSIGVKYEVNYKDRLIKVDNTQWMSGKSIITLSNGQQYKADWMPMEIRGNPYETIPYDVQLIENINQIYNFVMDNSLSTLLFLTIPLILLGLVLFMYPEEVWKIEHIFTVAEGRPTDWAISSSKVGGVLIVFFSTIFPLFTL